MGRGVSQVSGVASGSIRVWGRLARLTVLALGSPGNRQRQLAADLLLARVTQLGLSSPQQQGDEMGPEAWAGAEGLRWGD